MAMLPRTRHKKLVLGFKVLSLVSVSVVYLLISVFSSEQRSDTYDVLDNPSRRHLLQVNNVTDHPNENCTSPAINEFPSDGFTREQRRHGAIVLHILLSCYLFVLLATVCDIYFVPAVKKFCSNLKMKEDIAGATIMAVANSSAELFINCVGTFVTEGDLGIGTIVGSAVFNILAIPASCGLFANMAMDIEWWPITRDSTMYGFAVIALIVVLEDGTVLLSEAIALVVLYSLYILLMCFNSSLSRIAHKIVAKIKRRNYYVEVMGETHPLLYRKNGKYQGIDEILQEEITLEDCEKLEESTNIWIWPKEETIKGKLWWIFTWPISFFLFLTIPDCRKHPRLYVITFFMCIIWIGITSYIISWLITVIGNTLSIPDSVMGLTFLAAGTSVPEAVSSVIVTKQGHATMGLSSSIGSNTFDILLCLGVPWLIKAAFYPKIPGSHLVEIHSEGINICTGALLSTLVLFYASLSFNKFRLDWKVGLTCLLIYMAFILVACLVELNVFFVVNVPTCDQ
uniref:Sodium/potassium/calcium exchanger 3-like n=1 Tax=Diabrotica virgifera virgifera TaxID=50390 RepID=A0A6P7F8W4_DIAVI